MTVDPYAAMSNTATATPPERAARNIPAGPVANRANPFATASQYGGGDFTPGPNLEDLMGRVCILIPRKEVEVEDLNDKSKTKLVWQTDLYVITGGPFTFWYQKVVKEDGRPDRKELTEYAVTNAVTPEDPFTVLGYRIYGGYINYKLGKVAQDRSLFVGVPTRVPQGPDAKKGATVETVAQAFEAWEKTGRKIPAGGPKFAWDMPDPSQEQMNAAMAWWNLNADKITLG